MCIPPPQSFDHHAHDEEDKYLPKVCRAVRSPVAFCGRCLPWPGWTSARTSGLTLQQYRNLVLRISRQFRLLRVGRRAPRRALQLTSLSDTPPSCSSEAGGGGGGGRAAGAHRSVGWRQGGGRPAGAGERGGQGLSATGFPNRELWDGTSVGAVRARRAQLVPARMHARCAPRKPAAAQRVRAPCVAVITAVTVAEF